MRVLYIGDAADKNIKDGGAYGRIRNRRMLCSLFDSIDIIEVPKISYLKHLKNVILRKSYGHTRQVWRNIKRSFSKNYDLIFFDGSLWGDYVKEYDKRGKKVVVFYHNVEFDYYETKYRSKKNLINLILKKYVRFNERLSTLYSNKRILLNERDSNRLKEIYKCAGDMILPIMYKQINNLEKNSHYLSKYPYLLFVGSNFCSNNEGICWFIENVSSNIKINLHVVGSCCSAIKDRIDIDNYPNVQLLGFVEDLDKEYKEAVGVVCPIFTGSGMKTKTIEALRYGKTIFGTSEAFMGVEGDYNKIGGLCNTVHEFLEAINHMKYDTYNNYSMETFKKYYSEDVVYPKFKHFLESI